MQWSEYLISGIRRAEEHLAGVSAFSPQPDHNFNAVADLNNISQQK